MTNFKHSLICLLAWMPAITSCNLSDNSRKEWVGTTYEVKGTGFRLERVNLQEMAAFALYKSDVLVDELVWRELDEWDQFSMRFENDSVFVRDFEDNNFKRVGNHPQQYFFLDYATFEDVPFSDNNETDLLFRAYEWFNDGTPAISRCHHYSDEKSWIAEMAPLREAAESVKFPYQPRLNLGAPQLRELLDCAWLGAEYDFLETNYRIKRMNFPFLAVLSLFNGKEKVGEVWFNKHHPYQNHFVAYANDSLFFICEHNGEDAGPFQRKKFRNGELHILHTPMHPHDSHYTELAVKAESSGYFISLRGDKEEAVWNNWEHCRKIICNYSFKDDFPTDIPPASYREIDEKPLFSGPSGETFEEWLAANLTKANFPRHKGIAWADCVFIIDETGQISTGGCWKAHPGAPSFGDVMQQCPKWTPAKINRRPTTVKFFAAIECDGNNRVTVHCTELY